MQSLPRVMRDCRAAIAGLFTMTRCLKKDAVNVRWRTLIEQMLSRGGPRLYQKPAVTREGQVHHRELMCRIFDGNEEVSSAEYMPMVLQFGLIGRV
ncbi:putative signal transduction protein [Escherichia coli]|uniref:Putative signal transduction protein n=1 Tax=Escherichia coli TaxID=562 RepID=A0A376LBZ5_ECOLX|nr:putative signal transduction protein [Escherichia coli]